MGQSTDKQNDTTESTDNSEKPKKKRKDRRVEREYYDYIEVTDPTSGQLIKQRVKITKYKTKGDRFSYKLAVEEEELGYSPIAEDEDL